MWPAMKKERRRKFFTIDISSQNPVGKTFPACANFSVDYTQVSSSQLSQKQEMVLPVFVRSANNIVRPFSCQGLFQIGNCGFV